MKVSNCCGKQGFVEVLNKNRSAAIYVDAEEVGICPRCLEHCEYVLNIEQDAQECDATKLNKEQEAGTIK